MTCILREYPKGLGKALVKIWRDNKIQQTPIACLRPKKTFQHMTSEFQLFNSLPMGDTWPDAKLADCFFYLWTCKRVAIPQEWRETMKLFAKELKAVPLHLFGGRGFKGLPSIRVVPILSYCVALLPILPSRPEVHDPHSIFVWPSLFRVWIGGFRP